MRQMQTPLFLPLLVAPFLPAAVAQFENDFAAYPSAAQSCLYSAASGSGCSGDTVTKINSCLCGNELGGWVSISALCLGSSGVGSEAIADTYSQMETNCGNSNTPLGLSREDFFDTVSAAQGDDNDDGDDDNHDEGGEDKIVTETATATATKKETGEEKTVTATKTAEGEDRTVVVTVSDGSGTTFTTAVKPSSTNSVTVVLTVSGSATTLTTEITGGAVAEVTGTTSTAPATTSATEPADGDDEGSLSGGAKIGIIAGAAGAGVLAVAAAVYLVMRRRVNKARYEVRQSTLPAPHQSVVGKPPSTVLSSPQPSTVTAAYAGGGATSPGPMDGKWTRPESQVYAAAAAGNAVQQQQYQPQTQWGQQPQQQPQTHSPPPMQQVQEPHAVPVNSNNVGAPAQQQHYTAELPDTHDPQFHELDSGAQQPQHGGYLPYQQPQYHQQHGQWR